MYLSGTEMQQATGGTWFKGMPDSISQLQSDSRNFKSGSAFIALRGPNFDGHRFAHSIAQQAKALIGDHRGIKGWHELDVPQLEVADTLVALGDMARAWRDKLSDTTVIAITGSYGKTTLRSMLTHIFEALDIRVAATRGNLNNLIGVPMTLLDIDQDTEVALIECGISEKGEMLRLSSIVQADIAVVTGITAAHSEGLGGLDGVAHEKALLFKHLRPQGWCALGKHVSEHLGDMPHEYIENFVDFDLQGTTLTLRHGEEEAGLSIALPALHWAENMAFATSIVLQYCQRKHPHISLPHIAKALNSWQPVQGRMQSMTGIHGSNILDDSYNANPVSMQAALNTLAAMPGRRMAILGDMAELGGDANRLHCQLDTACADTLILVGNHMHALHKKRPQSTWFAKTEDLLTWLNTHQDDIACHDHILIKASRSVGLDRAVKLLAGKGGRHAV